MDQFSYLSVLLSIILGLAITQVLKGFRGIFLARDRTLLYWPSVVWAALLLLIFTQTWWAMFGLRNEPNWHFLGFAIVLIHCILLYMMAALILPDFFGTEPIDLHSHYYAHRVLWFSIAIITVAVSLLKDFVLDGHFTNATNLSFHLFFAFAAVIALLTTKDWVHKTLVVAFGLVFCCYTVVLFADLDRDHPGKPSVPATLR